MQVGYGYPRGHLAQFFKQYAKYRSRRQIQRKEESSEAVKRGDWIVRDLHVGRLAIQCNRKRFTFICNFE